MQIEKIIREIDNQILALERAKALLNGTTQTTTTGKKQRGRPRKNDLAVTAPVKRSGPQQPRDKAKRGLSQEGKERIAAAQRARWAAIKKNK
jgi:hypothetical protein